MTLSALLNDCPCSFSVLKMTFRTPLKSHEIGTSFKAKVLVPCPKNCGEVGILAWEEAWGSSRCPAVVFVVPFIYFIVCQLAHAKGTKILGFHFATICNFLVNGGGYACLWSRHLNNVQVKGFFLPMSWKAHVHPGVTQTVEWLLVCTSFSFVATLIYQFVLVESSGVSSPVDTNFSSLCVACLPCTRTLAEPSCECIICVLPKCFLFLVHLLGASRNITTKLWVYRKCLGNMQAHGYVLAAEYVFKRKMHKSGTLSVLCMLFFKQSKWKPWPYVLKGHGSELSNRNLWRSSIFVIFQLAIQGKSKALACFWSPEKGELWAPFSNHQSCHTGLWCGLMLLQCLKFLTSA